MRQLIRRSGCPPVFGLDMPLSFPRSVAEPQPRVFMEPVFGLCLQVQPSKSSVRYGVLDLFLFPDMLLWFT